MKRSLKNDLGDFKKDILKDLLVKRILYLDGSIDHEKAKAFCLAMVWLNSNDPVKDIDLYIDSFGGSVEESLTIYDTIVNSSAPVTGIVCRQAKSMASVILQGCKKRVAYKNATVLIHDISRGEVKLEELETADNLDRLVSEMRKMQGKVHSILAKRTGKSIQQIRGECRKNRPMDADEALKFGLIDKIV